MNSLILLPISSIKITFPALYRPHAIGISLQPLPPLLHVLMITSYSDTTVTHVQGAQKDQLMAVRALPPKRRGISVVISKSIISRSSDHHYHLNNLFIKLNK